MENLESRAIYVDSLSNSKQIKDELYNFCYRIVMEGKKELVDEKQLLANDILLISGLISVMSQFLYAVVGSSITCDHLEKCKQLIEVANAKSDNKIN